MTGRRLGCLSEAPGECQGEGPGDDGTGDEDLPPAQLPGVPCGPPTLGEVTELRRFRMALPMASIEDRGLSHVGRIHSDHHEFAGEFKRWGAQRGIYLTKTPGDDPTGLGTTEGSPVQLPVTGAGGDGLEVLVRPLVQLPAASCPPVTQG